MSIVDIVILILVGAMAILGIYKGFIKSLLSLVGFVAALLITILLAKTVANALLGVDTIANWVAGESSLYSWLLKKLPASLANISSADLAASSDVKALFDSQAPWFLKLFYPLVSSGLKSEVFLASLINARQIMALELAYGIYVLIVEVALFIVLRILFAVFGMAFNRFTMGRKPFVGRIAGAIIGAARGVLYCMIILCIMAFMSNLSFMSSINKEVEGSSIASQLSDWSVEVSAKVLEDKPDGDRYQKLIDIVDKWQDNDIEIDHDTDDDDDSENTGESGGEDTDENGDNGENGNDDIDPNDDDDTDPDDTDDDGTDGDDPDSNEGDDTDPDEGNDD